jgi:hypothetical protein
MWRASKISVGVRSASFRDGHYGGDPGILENVAAGVFRVEPKLDEGNRGEARLVVGTEGEEVVDAR